MKIYFLLLISIVLLLSSCNRKIQQTNIQTQTDIEWKNSRVISNIESEFEQKNTTQITNTLVEKIQPNKSLNKKVNKIIAKSMIKNSNNPRVLVNEHFTHKSSISKNMNVNKTQCGSIPPEVFYILLGILLIIIGLLIWGFIVAPLLTSIISAILTLSIIILWNS